MLPYLKKETSGNPPDELHPDGRKPACGRHDARPCVSVGRVLRAALHLRRALQRRGRDLVRPGSGHRRFPRPPGLLRRERCAAGGRPADLFEIYPKAQWAMRNDQYKLVKTTNRVAPRGKQEDVENQYEFFTIDDAAPVPAARPGGRDPTHIDVPAAARPRQEAEGRLREAPGGASSTRWSPPSLRAPATATWTSASTSSTSTTGPPSRNVGSSRYDLDLNGLTNPDDETISIDATTSACAAP